MSDLRVLALAADEWGCGFYRIKEPVRVAQTAGVDAVSSDQLPATVDTYSDGRASVRSVDVDVDVIIFQRPLLETFGQAIEIAQRMGIACVVEIDDNLSRVHPRNMAAPGVDPRNNPVANYKHLERHCQMADLVTTTSSALAKHYAPHGRVKILPNMLPERIFSIEKTFPEQLRLGWTGTVGTHPYDLEQLGAHAATIARQTQSGFSIVGDGLAVREKLLLTSDIPVSVTGWVALDQYYQTIADNVDVGVAPLEMSQFNDGKSYLKMLEYSALGIPCVGSPTPEYQKFVQTFGVGRLAKRGIDWQKHLKRLLTDRDYLLEESARHRDAVRSETFENNAQDWIDAWSLARDNRRAAMNSFSYPVYI